MKLKPLVRVSESKNTLASWIIEKFPNDYQNLVYVEPFLGDGSVLLNKLPSAEEIVNDADGSLIKIWQAIRDEPKLFNSKLKKIDCKEQSFKKYQNKKEKDYVSLAATEFALRQMSKSGLKKSYFFKKKPREHCWKSFLEASDQIRERIKNIFILNKDPVSIIKAFGGRNSFIYCDIPPVKDGEENKHIELSESLIGSRGKVLIISHNSAMYKRLYSAWNRKNVPGKQKLAVWMNF